jgi:hypothetical protein
MGCCKFKVNGKDGITLVKKPPNGCFPAGNRIL